MVRSLVAACTTNKDAIPEQAIRDQLSRILESPLFIQSDRFGCRIRFGLEGSVPKNAHFGNDLQESNHFPQADF